MTANELAQLDAEVRAVVGDPSVVFDLQGVPHETPFEETFFGSAWLRLMEHARGESEHGS